MNYGKPIEAAAALAGAGFSLRASQGGALQVEVGEERYTIESFFSYPGEAIGTNALGFLPGSEAGWSPRVERAGPGQVRFEAAGEHYRLSRTVALQGHRIVITDTLANDGPEAVGILIGHRIIPSGALREIRVGGGPDPAVDPRSAQKTAAVEHGGYVEWAGLPVRHLSAENPTLYLPAEGSSLGVLAEDSISRLQFNGSVPEGRPQFSLCRFGLAARTSRTLRWALYPLGPGKGYFDFINQVRRDWGTNFTIQGPWGFFDVVHHRELLRDPARLRAYLQRKRLKIAALMPWLDYDNYNVQTRRLVGRQEYRAMMQEAATALKAADPGIFCTGCMEGNIVGLPEAAVARLYELIPPDRRQRGYPIPFNDEQEGVLRSLPLRWKDCLYTGPDGRHAYELYYRGLLYDPVGSLNEQEGQRVPMMALMVYAAPGNDHLAYWLDQACFMIEEVGLDGIYIDQFSLAFTELQRLSYERWDGLTVDIDPATGRIVRHCTDAAWTGAAARKELIEYVLSRGKVMVANSAAAVEEVQALPIARFMEAEFSGNVMDWRDGERPPLRFYPCKGHLGSPVALGSRPEMGGEAGVGLYARYIMRTAIDYLRHGVLFYHYLTEIPESGPGSGEYGALNHMFPFTPIALHEGWVEGQERMVTAVSGLYRWNRADRPTVRVFDLEGRAVERGVEPVIDSAGWRVELPLRDWAEIAVIEGTEVG